MSSPVIDIIKFDGFRDGRQWIAYKYPGEQFVLGTQLIVNPSQEAVFIKGGEIADLFGSGTHTLQTGNLPILKKLVNMPFGGKTPFSAEVYFVNKASRMDMTWGTATPFQIEDPKYGIIVSIRAHGKYGIRVADSGLFVGELVGTAPADSVFSHTFVNLYFNGILISNIKTRIASFMTREKVSFLEVTSYLTELSAECNAAVADEFARYGVEIFNLCIEAISPPPSDYENLKKMKEKYALGERVYVQERRLDMLDKIAENSGNPAVSAGAGLGIGIAAAKEMAGAFGSVMSGASASGTEKCSKCGAEVPFGQKFCGECGAKMERVCPSCGKKWDVSQKFCGECGTKL